MTMKNPKDVLIVVRTLAGTEYINCDPDELEARTGISRGLWQMVWESCAYPHKVVKEIYQAWFVKKNRKDDPLQEIFE